MRKLLLALTLTGAALVAPGLASPAHARVAFRVGAGFHAGPLQLSLVFGQPLRAPRPGYFYRSYRPIVFPGYTCGQSYFEGGYYYYDRGCPLVTAYFNHYNLDPQVVFQRYAPQGGYYDDGGGYDGYYDGNDGGYYDNGYYDNGYYDGYAPSYGYYDGYYPYYGGYGYPYISGSIGFYGGRGFFRDGRRFDGRDHRFDGRDRRFDGRFDGNDHRGWQGQPGHGGTWQGRPGGHGNPGTWQGQPGHGVTWQGRPGGGTWQGRPGGGGNRGGWQGRPSGGNPGGNGGNHGGGHNNGGGHHH